MSPRMPHPWYWAPLALLAFDVSISADPPVAPAIERVATLSTARSVHTATALPSGKVLIAGGMGSDQRSLATAELYDPRDHRVEVVGSLAEPRSGHTATLLPDGRVLIAGGFDGRYHASVEIYDPASRRFTAGGSLREGRNGHTATLLRDGRVLMVGGTGQGWSFLASAELYDPATGRSEPVPSMSVPREGHTATLLSDGRVLVVGGHTGRRLAMTVHATAEVFDPATGRFAPVGQLGIARHKHDAIALADGRVLVIGGADVTDRLYYASVELFDPRTGTFRSGGSLHNRRYKLAGTSVLLPNGEVLITSGATVAEIFDPRSETFREVEGSFPEAYHFAAAAGLAGGSVVVSGGYSHANRSTAGVWRFRP